jgi:hypothetical protein
MCIIDAEALSFLIQGAIGPIVSSIIVLNDENEGLYCMIVDALSLLVNFFIQCQNCERNRCAKSPSPVTSTVYSRTDSRLAAQFAWFFWGGMNQWTHSQNQS